MADKLPDVCTLTCEQARGGPVRIVASLERGTASLDESVTLWERGEALAARCEEWLVGARARLEAARKNAE